MPNCRKCEQHFPNNMIIEGRQRNLGTRKYCLKCSPFRTHNTAILEEQIRLDNGFTECRTCGRAYFYDRKKGHTKTKCNSCSISGRRHQFKKKCVSVLGEKCIVCGYDKSLNVLGFHHIDPSQKDFGIAGSHNRKWSIVEAELKKCILMCSNCHGERHELEGI